MVAFNICDEGEGIMFTTPTYAMFGRDLTAKAGATLLPVSTDGIEDQFSAKCVANLIEGFERVYNKATASGVKVKAVLLCNPSNPVGRFYSKETLVAVARFCGERKMHLVCDEIYANSEFSPAPGESFLENFTSVLSLKDDPASSIYKENIHAFYGASKDFGMGGLRLGFLITRNEEVWKACRRVA
jgi:aspartate/methionine/tyrosine aminotransferase